MRLRLPLAILTLVVARQIGADAGASVPPLSMADFLSARWPSRASWSSDGRYVSFLSTDWSEQNLYVVPVDGGDAVALTRGEGFVGGPSWDAVDAFGSWSRDGRRLAFNVRGEIRIAMIAGATVAPVDRSSPDSEVRFSPTDDSLAFVRDGDLMVADARHDARQLTQRAHLGSAFTWSPDGQKVAATVSDGGHRTSASPSFLAPLLSVNWSVRGSRHAVIVDVRSGAVRAIPNEGADEAVLAWSPDSKTVLIERRSSNLKERSLRLVDATDADATRLLYEQRDPKHLATNNQVAAFSPDGRQLLLTSDADGWNHLYVTDVAAGVPRQVTKGDYEVSFPFWSANSRSIVFASTQGGPAERHIYSVAAAGGTPARLTSSSGVNSIPVPSPDGRRLLFVHSDPRRLPDYWTMQAAAGTVPAQLTHSMGPALRAETWQEPRIVSFTSKDGLRISAQLFTPASGDRARKYPAIVQVHEASAMNQHVFAGPGPQKNHVGWYGWHQRLAERGYVVLNIDYRGSFGYGRSFRTADYLVMGQAPLEDAIAGVEFLRTVGNVDVDHIAAVGLSAGGRMVLSLLGKYPDTFAAGVDLAGIYDYLLPGGPWDTRNSWTTARLDTPDAHPESYRDASPKTFVPAISKPLLILHGTADTNVPITHSLALVEDLVSRGKRFDFAVYPGEVHFFARRSSWLDAFERMEAFLDRELAPKKTGAPVGDASAADASGNTNVEMRRRLASQD